MKTFTNELGDYISKNIKDFQKQLPSRLFEIENENKEIILTHHLKNTITRQKLQNKPELSHNQEKGKLLKRVEIKEIYQPSPKYINTKIKLTESEMRNSHAISIKKQIPTNNAKYCHKNGHTTDNNTNNYSDSVPSIDFYFNITSNIVKDNFNSSSNNFQGIESKEDNNKASWIIDSGTGIN
ncbi:hypothetical protein U3516DRAFT_767701 [Neocallimastix sp. 'constans']